MTCCELLKQIRLKLARDSGLTFVVGSGSRWSIESALWRKSQIYSLPWTNSSRLTRCEARPEDRLAHLKHVTGAAILRARFATALVLVPRVQDRSSLDTHASGLRLIDANPRIRAWRNEHRANQQYPGR